MLLHFMLQVLGVFCCQCIPLRPLLQLPVANLSSCCVESMIPQQPICSRDTSSASSGAPQMLLLHDPHLPIAPLLRIGRLAHLCRPRLCPLQIAPQSNQLVRQGSAS